MFKSFFLIQIIVFISLAIYPQTTSDVVLNNWSRFKISNLNISILFPHLPIKIEGGDQCKDEKNEEYAAYQKGVVYRFNVTYEMKLGSGKLCTNHKNFDENSFTDYLKELKGNQNLTETEINGRKSFQILLANKTYWLINDYPNKRWFEFWVMGANDEKKEVTDFLASLNFNVTNTDTEINDGAEKTIGDENVENVEGKVGVTPLIIALKPRANYTDVARQNQVQGTVIGLSLVNM